MATDIKKTVKQLEKTVHLTHEEATAIYNHSKHPFGWIYTAFLYGHLKGFQAARADKKLQTANYVEGDK